MGDLIMSIAQNLKFKYRSEFDVGEQERMNKFIFLAERLIIQSKEEESEEAYEYDKKRFAGVFNLDAAEWDKRTQLAASPLYEEALEKAVLDGSLDATTEQLLDLRKELGISLTTAEELHSRIFSKKVAQLIKPEMGANAILTDEAKETLEEVRGLLGMDPFFAGMQRASIVDPLFEATLTGAFPSLDKDAIKTLQVDIVRRQRELDVTNEAAKEMMHKVMRKHAEELLEKGAELVKWHQANEAVKMLTTLMDFVTNTEKLLRELGFAVEDSPSIYKNLYKEIGLKDAAQLDLYEIMLVDALDDLRLDDEEKARFSSLRSLLGISVADSDRLTDETAAPLFQAKLKQAVKDEMSVEQKANLQESINNLDLRPSVIATACKNVYKAELQQLLTGGTKLITEDQAKKLEELREFVGLTAEQVYDIHDTECKDMYQSAVKEVIGTSGAVPEAYWQGLEKLRERLTFSPVVADELMVDEFHSMIAQKAGKVLEVSSELQSGAQSDGTLTRLVLDLVDFCVAKRVIVPTKEKVTEDDGQVVEKEVLTCRAPLTFGAKKFDRQAIEAAYKQYLIEGFRGTNATENQRLFENRHRLALVLGLGKDTVAEIQSSLFNTIATRSLKESLEASDTLGPKDLQFLNAIRDMLDVPQSVFDKLMKSSLGFKATKQLDKVMGKIPLNTTEVREVLSYAEGLELDTIADMDMPPLYRELVLSRVVDDLIRNQEITADDTSALEELTEQLHVSQERTNEVLEESVAKVCTDVLGQALGLFLTGDKDATIARLNVMLDFARISPSTDEDLPILNTRQSMFVLYERNAEASSADVELLRTVLGLRDDQLAASGEEVETQTTSEAPAPAR
jgi:hypothetical protein